MEQELKDLVLRTLPNPSKFVFNKSTKSLTCNIHDLHLFISFSFERLWLSVVVVDRKISYPFNAYSSTCFDLTELEDEFKVMRSRLEHRGFIPGDVEITSKENSVTNRVYQPTNKVNITEQKLKDLIFKTLPNPSKFIYSESIHSMYCYIHDLYLFISFVNERLQFSAMVMNQKNTKPFKVYSSTCFDFLQLEDEFKAMRNRLEHRGFIPVEVAV